MTGGNEVAVRSLDGLAALWRTFEYLFAHGIIIALVCTAAVTLAWFAAERNAKPSRLELGAYCGAFATFGVATAYFLSLGLNAASTTSNSLLTSFVGPFISLLTAAVAYAASKNSNQIAKNDLVLGVTCFLLACILSYETFNGQILYGMGADVVTPTNPATGNRIGPDLPQPSNGHATNPAGAISETPPAPNGSNGSLPPPTRR